MEWISKYVLWELIWTKQKVVLCFWWNYSLFILANSYFTFSSPFAWNALYPFYLFLQEHFCFLCTLPYPHLPFRISLFSERSLLQSSVQGALAAWLLPVPGVKCGLLHAEWTALEPLASLWQCWWFLLHKFFFVSTRLDKLVSAPQMKSPS